LCCSVEVAVAELEVLLLAKVVLGVLCARLEAEEEGPLVG
jgi:hypothetical protein